MLIKACVKELKPTSNDIAVGIGTWLRPANGLSKNVDKLDCMVEKTQVNMWSSREYSLFC